MEKMLENLKEILLDIWPIGVIMLICILLLINWRKNEKN